MAIDAAFETGHARATATAARAITERGLQGTVVRGIIDANREALSGAINEHPVYGEGRGFVRQIEAGGTVQVRGVSRLPSGFRNYQKPLPTG